MTREPWRERIAGPWCYACGHAIRGGMAVHLSTRRHREVTRPPTGKVARGAPSWRRALREDDPGDDAANRAAAERLGVTWRP